MVRAWPAGLILLALLLAGRGLLEGYSYWSDEIWSVAASQASWGGLFQDWLIPDTHPPLYQSLLKLWISLWGRGETATRSLSFLMITIGLVAAAAGSPGDRGRRRIVTLAFLGTSPSLLFYGQETRSYATSLALSSVMLASVLLLRQPTPQGAREGTPSGRREGVLRWVFALSSLLLSLTHYFSLLFVLVVLAIGTAQGSLFRRRMTALPLLGALLIWPVLHGLLSTPAETLRRLDWIKVEPLVGTLREFLRGTLPVLDPDQGPLALLALLALAGALACLCAQPLRRGRGRAGTDDRDDKALRDSRFLLLVLLGFLGLMLPIDLLKPLSQGRYYIVAVPALAYLVGASWQLAARAGRWRRNGFALLLSLLLLLQLRLGLQQLALKRVPLENYAAMARFVRRSGICREGCSARGWPLGSLMATYFTPGELVDPPDPEAPRDGPAATPLLLFHDAEGSRAETTKAVGHSCWEAPGAWPRAVVILLPGTSASHPERHGLRPCPP